MLPMKTQIFAGIALVVAGIIALTFARWFADDFILVAGMGAAYALGRFSK